MKITFRPHSVSGSKESLTIFVFATHYPSIFKPYYDTQIAELIDRGHHVSVFAMEPQGSEFSRLVRDYEIAGRTQYLLADAPSTVLRLLPRVCARVLRQPSTFSRACAIARWAQRPRTKLKHVVRALALPTDAPDICWVQSHETMVMVPWLHELYPAAAVALQYYGGVPAEAGIRDSDATRRSFEGASVVFALTRFARDEAIALGSSPDRTRVLPLGFRIQDFPETQRKSFPLGQRLRVISAGRLSEGKGHLVALAALAQLRDRTPIQIEYEIVGSGPMEPTLKAFVAEHDLGGIVSFPGSLPHERLLGRLERSDVLLLPSVPTASWNETQGAVMQEALLSGALVVASRTGGIPESLPPFLSDFLVPPGDSAALAGQLERLIAMPVGDAIQLAKRGAQWVRTHYDNRILVGRLIDECLSA